MLVKISFGDEYARGNSLIKMGDEIKLHENKQLRDGGKKSKTVIKIKTNQNNLTIF